MRELFPIDAPNHVRKIMLNNNILNYYDLSLEDFGMPNRLYLAKEVVGSGNAGDHCYFDNWTFRSMIGRECPDSIPDWAQRSYDLTFWDIEDEEDIDVTECFKLFWGTKEAIYPRLKAPELPRLPGAPWRTSETPIRDIDAEEPSDPGFYAVGHRALMSANLKAKLKEARAHYNEYILQNIEAHKQHEAGTCECGMWDTESDAHPGQGN